MAGAGAGAEADAKAKVESEAEAKAEVEGGTPFGRPRGGERGGRGGVLQHTACPCNLCMQAEEDEEESNDCDYGSFSSCDEAPEDDQEPGRLVCPYLLLSDINTLGVS